ncbi:MAG: relaxase/mobilization nuclease domain-containing protein, partial [Flavobacteriales bacterium]|nr:relaxase/mobilization nuclease domain-containing protein [Flavobacteriales bacterium]
TVSESESVNLKSKNFDLIHSLNSRVKLKGFDIPFTFDKTDKMDNRKFSDLFLQFQKDMGFENRPYAIYRHDDTENLHYHVIIGNVSFDGVPNPELRKRYRTKATKLARKYEEKYSLRRLKAIGESEYKAKKKQELNAEKYSYQKSLLANDGKTINLTEDEKIYLSGSISNSEFAKNNKLESKIKYLLSNDLILKSNKQKLVQILDGVKEKNVVAYIKKCQDNNLYCRIVKRPKIHFVYGIKDKDGKLMHFKENQLPRKFSYINIVNKSSQKSLGFSEEKQKQYLKTIIKRVLLKTNSLDDLKNILLGKYNIETIINSNSKAASGVSFVSLNGVDDKIFKGSELGYSYNNLQKLFIENNKQKEKIIINRREDDINNSNKKQTTPSLVDDLDNNIASVLGMENFVDEEEEKRKKRKKKRKKGKGL